MKKGFTLAEVLITLGIIGIVAALTMPALVANYQEKATVAKLKKIYSIMSQAYAQVVAEYGTPDGWNLIANGSSVGAQNMAEKFKPYLKVIGEKPGGTYKLADGSIIIFHVRDPDCLHNRGTGSLAQGCGFFGVDLKEKGTKEGIDHFSFAITKDAILPFGTGDDTMQPIMGNCLAAGSNRQSCAAWVIYKENMDYLHCDYLSWDGKTKCD